VSAVAPIMRAFRAGLIAGMTLLVRPAHADQPTMPHIGIVVLPLSTSLREQSLRDGLRELGYVEGQNIVIDWRRSAGGAEERGFAAELARSKLDVIVVFSTPAAQAALAAGAVPVVFLSGDPVGAGLASSLARPGGNATGVSGVLTELAAKRLQLFHRLVPRARRIGCLVNPSDPAGVRQFDAAQQAGRDLGVQIIRLEARDEGELDAALRALSPSTMDGVLVPAEIMLRANKTKVAKAIRKARLPGAFPARDYHADGALMSYGPDLKQAPRKMAAYVDKILKGAKPGDLPIEQISKYELVIDLRIARELGLKVPEELLQAADEVIK